MIHTILDPGNIYAVGFGLMAMFTAAVLYVAKRSQERNGETNIISMRPIQACLGVAATMSIAMLAKASLFADYYDAYSIYAPGT